MKWPRILISMLLCAEASSANADEVLRVDARNPVPPVRERYIKLGTSTAPDGSVIGINNRYLTMNGRPWVPVMGEIHFVRQPRAEWDEALAKMKQSGVDIVATYLFWNYHEPTAGRFYWGDDKDLRYFLQLAQRHGLKVMLRLGPWAHGEVRYGGLPDWVVHDLPLRSSDPRYMALVERYWRETAVQTRGMLWKDGGPVIGVQLENEYNLTGPLRGEQHIMDLKALAIATGFDVPLYTITGWDRANYPRREVAPVFGGYPDMPWGTTAEKLPPKEIYAFRFDSRVNGDLGAQTKGVGGDTDRDRDNVPFLGAEFGGGIPTMYRRRPIISPDDVAAMLPVALGSGNNLYGYYMYFGGRNAIDRNTLEESTLVGGYNDCPIIEYDFQAPYGQYGEKAASADYLRPFHYFLQSYGSALAPMDVRKPEGAASVPTDLSTLRWSLRVKGDSGFVFVNNYVRQYAPKAHPGVQFRIDLPDRKVTFPSHPVDVATGAYFIWPMKLDLGGQTLDWASAQPVTRLDTTDGPVHVFEAQPGIPAEFAFPAGTQVSGAGVSSFEGHVVAHIDKTARPVVVRRAGQPTIRILLLTQQQARRLWVSELGGIKHLLLTDASVIGNGAGLDLISKGSPNFTFSAWPALPTRMAGSLPIRAAGRDGIFFRYAARAATRAIPVGVKQIRDAGLAPPVRIGGRANAVMQPWPEDFGDAAGAWEITIPKDSVKGVDDAYLTINWQGDIARLFRGDAMIDDRYYSGLPWRVGLRRIAQDATRFVIRVMPLRKDAPVYVEDGQRPDFDKNGQVARLGAVTIDPQYRLRLTLIGMAAGTRPRPIDRQRGSKDNTEKVQLTWTN